MILKIPRRIYQHVYFKEKNQYKVFLLLLFHLNQEGKLYYDFKKTDFLKELGLASNSSYNKDNIDAIMNTFSQFSVLFYRKDKNGNLNGQNVKFIDDIFITDEKYIVNFSSQILPYFINNNFFNVDLKVILNMQSKFNIIAYLFICSIINSEKFILYKNDSKKNIVANLYYMLGCNDSYKKNKSMYIKRFLESIDEVLLLFNDYKITYLEEFKYFEFTIKNNKVVNSFFKTII